MASNQHIPTVAVTLIYLLALAQSTLSTNSTTTQSLRTSISVHTTSGLLHGTKQVLNSIGNSSVYKFLAVPYALPPTGQLRFKKPVELPGDRALSQVDSSKHGNTCPQFRHLARFISPLLNLDSEHQTSEDCLHLNVYVPSGVGKVDSANKLEPTKQLPVIVWIPGEGFDFADARQYDGSYLAQQTQSIVVTVQYRVGVLGFLDAPHLGIAGNMGIHDQIMALRWVRKNIGSFGGDSERVTVMGRFSGSMTISTMLTAPKDELIRLNGQPLFKRAVMLSGVAVEDWIIEQNQAEKLEQLYSQALKKGFCTKSQILDESCLQILPADQLLEVSGHGWRLVVDNELISRGGPISAIEEGHTIPGVDAVLLGETATEGTLCLYRHMLNSNNDYAQLIHDNLLTSKSLNEIIGDDSLTYFKYNITESNPMRVALESILDGNNFVDAEEHDFKLRDKYLDACSSYMVKAHAKRFKRNLQARNLQVEKSLDRRPIEVFHYELKYKPTFSLAPHYIKTATHGDDIPLIFGLVLNQPKHQIDEADLLMTRKMMSYIGNFVHGNHPLLLQHPPINNENNKQSSELQSEIGSEEIDGGQNTMEAPLLWTLISRRSWSRGEQVYSVDLDENEYNNLSTGRVIVNIKQQQNQKSQQNSMAKFNSVETLDSMNTNTQLTQSRVAERDNGKANLKMILMENPQMVELKAIPQVDLLEQRQANTRSQRLLELHRQQFQDNYWLFNPRRNQLVAVPQIPADIVQSSISSRQSRNHIASSIVPTGEQQQPTSVAESQLNNQQGAGVVVSSSSQISGDSYLMSALLIGACVVIFALTSFCIVLSLIVFRYNLTGPSNIEAKKRFNSSSSTCNICDDAQGSSIDAVLNVASANHACNANPNEAPKKGNHGFCNMFAKLRPHTDLHTEHHQPQTMCHSGRQLHKSPTNTPAACKNHLQVDGLIEPQEMDENFRNAARH